MNNKKIVFISPAISAVHIRKRVCGLVENGYEVVVYAFDRGDGALAEYPDSVKVFNLGLVPNGREYFSKFFGYIPILRKIFRQYSNENVIYIACSFDLALITKYFSKKKYVYHISDIVYGYFNPLLYEIFKFVDKSIIASSEATIITSNGFRNFLRTKKNANKFIYQPNNLSPYFKDKVINLRKIKNYSSLTFGFTGFIRFESIYNFAEVVGRKFPNHKFFFYGKAESEDRLKSLLNKYNNIFFFGSFVSPDDLEKIYSDIDIVVSCYDVTSLNVRLAEPNKLFEALFFKKPIIVSENTFLLEQVNYFGVGFGVNAASENSIINVINSITEVKVSELINNIIQVTNNVLIDNNSMGLVNAISKIK